MKRDRHEADDVISAAAERFKQRRDQQRIEAEAAIRARDEHRDFDADRGSTRNLLIGGFVVALIAAAGWFLVTQMQCGDRYSAISGFLFHECR